MTQRDGDSDETGQDYQSYLIRLLRTHSGETQVWRVTLEEPLTQKVYHLESLHELFAFLMARTGQVTMPGRISLLRKTVSIVLASTVSAGS